MARMQNLALKGPMPTPRYSGESNDPGLVGRERMHALRNHTMLTTCELQMMGRHSAEDHGGARYWFVRDKLYFSACVVGERISYAAY